MSEERGKIIINRSSITTNAAAIDGLYHGLVAASQTGAPVSAVTLQLVRAISSRVTETTVNIGFEHWPTLPDDAAIGDLVVFAATLRSIYFSFLSPEETEEYRQSSAFNLAAFQRDKNR